jgi:peptidoglycan/xylan/chitin deacetylase (PgdA/CDA1 family)
LITFDDGRVDSYRGADKVLARYHYQATMFVVAAWVTQHPGPPEYEKITTKAADAA